jgi:putative membrane protein
MKYMILSWLISAGAFLACAYYIPGFHVASLQAALMAAFALGVCNAIIRPIVILFTLPLTVLTLGLSLLVVNAAMLGLAAYFVPGVTIANIGVAVVAALVISIVNAIAGAVLG